MPDAPYISVVIPAYNEAGGIAETINRTLKALDPIHGDREIIVVDDGSTDQTASVVEALISSNPSIKLVCLSRNFGHQNAIAAGLNSAQGDVVAIIDADLQDPPELIPKMIEVLNQGYDVVYGIRGNREESFVKRVAYSLYYHLLSILSEQPMPRNAGDFSVMTRRVVQELNQLPEKGRYIRGLRNWVGFPQTGYTYDRPSREQGSSKYRWRNLFKLASRGVLSSSRFPLKVSIYLGTALAAVGFAWAIKVIFVRLYYDTAPEGFSALMVAILVIGGAQLMATGVLGIYLSRVLDQVEERPSFIVRRRVERTDNATTGKDDLQD